MVKNKASMTLIPQCCVPSANLETDGWNIANLPIFFGKDAKRAY